LAHWSYGSDSAYGSRSCCRGVVSSEGVKQGDVLASLLFALSMKNIYAESIEGLDCHSVAVMDDLYLVGPSGPTFSAFDRFASRLPEAGLSLNRSKSLVLLPSPSPANKINHPQLNKLCNQRQLSYNRKSIPALGGLLSRNPKIVKAWLLSQVPTQHSSFFDFLRNPRLPSQHAFALLRVCVLPRMNFWGLVFSLL
jgi:hypothetical protein